MYRTWTLAIALLLCPFVAAAQNVRPDTAGVLAAEHCTQIGADS
jgi:hypothetical protein